MKTPPFSPGGRVEAGYLLRRLQQGASLGFPDSRPMPTSGARCHELRVADGTNAWRIIYRLDADAVVILDVFKKTTRKTPQSVIQACRQRMRRYDASYAEE